MAAEVVAELQEEAPGGQIPSQHSSRRVYGLESIPRAMTWSMWTRSRRLLSLASKTTQKSQDAPSGQPPAQASCLCACCFPSASILNISKNFDTTGVSTAVVAEDRFPPHLQLLWRLLRALEETPWAVPPHLQLLWRILLAVEETPLLMPKSIAAEDWAEVEVRTRYPNWRRRQEALRQCPLRVPLAPDPCQPTSSEVRLQAPS
mmetsp:Transcript_114675/g.180531  ORF Transcript_114675/g.180531 Transcript_114675/m.180531 type:complete len:204 (+) Transcript_114675:517-1128(+)